ncbi:Hypothetical protein AKI40_3996 [Enterobacter sp. FY-07]|nr:Hypothetical protein AKI40_3996 [Enterobacter sp. FY-07]
MIPCSRCSSHDATHYRNLDTGGPAAHSLFSEAVVIKNALSISHNRLSADDCERGTGSTAGKIKRLRQEALFYLCSLLVVCPGANMAQSGVIDTIWLTIHRRDQLLAPEFFKHRKRAIAEQQSFAGVAFNGGNTA